MNEHILSMRQPATRWEDASPSGNGTIGALVYGSLQQERVVLNHEDLWLPLWDKPNLPEMAKHLPRYRQLLEAGKHQEADKFWRGKLTDEGWPDMIYTNVYQPAFDLRLTQQVPAAHDHYERTLDMTTGEVIIRWNVAGVKYERRLFVSRPDGVIVMRLTASRKGAVGAKAWVDVHPMFEDNRKMRHYPRAYTAQEMPLSFAPSAKGEFFRMDVTHTRKVNTNRATDGYGAVGKMIAKGAKVATDGTGVVASGADEIVVLIKVVKGKPTPAIASKLKKELDALGGNYDALLKRHVKEHGELYKRISLDLGDKANAGALNEKLVADAYADSAPNALLERLFNFGRYLFISATRPGGLPVNLQGVWNGDYIPAWSSDYTLDENVQMMHWAALPGNVPELLEPYFRYFEGSLADWRENARKFYGCRGVMTCLRQSDHGLMAENMPYMIWTAGAGWLAKPFWDYYLHTGDKKFLADRAVPFFKEVALFYEDFLYEGKDGKLTICPSMSPENIPDVKGAGRPSINPTMDVAVCREVFASLIQACQELGIEEANVAKWQAIVARLPEYSINEDGALKEWLRPELKDNYHHRHLSHIYPLFPGFEFTQEATPKLFKACQVAVRKRLVVGIEEQTGWSLAHMANIYARMAEGDHALETLDLMARSCLGQNLFTYHNDWRRMGTTMDMPGLPPVQLDANMGLTAAVFEMLVFSLPGIIKFLPALPKRWAKGSIQGVLCRGQVIVSVEWDVKAKQFQATLKSAVAQTVTIKLPAWVKTVSARGAKLEASKFGKQYRQVALPAGKVVEIKA